MLAARILLRIAPLARGKCSLRHLSTTQALFVRQNVIVPPLAESLSEGDIKFEKEIGQIVSEDEIVASIETDKTSVPINSPFAGKIVEFLVEDSSTVKPGQSVLVIDTDAAGEAKSNSKTTITKPESKPEDAPTQTSAQQPSTPPALAQEKSSTPVDQVKLELDSLNNTSQARTVKAVKMNRMRFTISKRLKDAQNTYAMLTTFNEIDMSNLIEMRLKYKEAFLKKHKTKLGFMSAFVKASAYALNDQPVVNAVIDGNQILYHNYVDISVAVATPKGLVVPVLRNVEQMNFADIEKTINQLGEKARNNELTVADMEGGTFTISNGGVFGSLFGTPIINPPQSAILGMHAINDRPAAVNGQVVIRPVMFVALTYDHRLVDGREAVTFLKKIKDVIEDPRTILMDL